MEIDGRITTNIFKKEIEIDLKDYDANIKIARILLSQDQLFSLLRNQSLVKCKIELFDNFVKIGKKMINKSFSFEISGKIWSKSYTEEVLEEIHEIALKKSPKGWVPDNYYKSQNSFYKKKGKYYARTEIRRWE